MDHQPLVSILTPCFNHAAYLEDYFEGLLAQTYENLELILIDDGSTDESWAVISAYERRIQARFRRVDIRRQSNVGFHMTLERGLSRTTGTYTCILESDDYYLPTKIARSVEYLLAHPEVGLVHTDTNYIWPDRIESSYWSATGRQIPTGWVYEALLDGNFIMTCSVCCRTDILKRHVSFARYAVLGYRMADYPMCLDLARHARFGYIPEALSCYRRLAESASHSLDSEKRFRFWASGHCIRLDYAAAHLRTVDHPASEFFKEARRDEYRGVAYWLREAGWYTEALRCLLQIIRIWGWHSREIAAIAKLAPHGIASKLTGSRPYFGESTLPVRIRGRSAAWLGRAE